MEPIYEFPPYENFYIVEDILEHIHKLNILITMHKSASHISMAAQYIHLRAEFYEKLKTALADIEIAAELQHLEKAA